MDFMIFLTLGVFSITILVLLLFAALFRTNREKSNEQFSKLYDELEKINKKLDNKEKK